MDSFIRVFPFKRGPLKMGAPLNDAIFIKGCLQKGDPFKRGRFVRFFFFN